MLHRLLRFPAILSTLSLLLLLVLAPRNGSFRSSASPQAANPKHGLSGSYYVANTSVSTDVFSQALASQGYYAQVWLDPNDFQLPRPFTSPAAARVDAQIAFGQGKGFSGTSAKPAAAWWPTGFALAQGKFGMDAKPWENLAAAIWKGYIHLPKAGTYYFTTISNGPSAVFLNEARVALNGVYGGALSADTFSYAKEDTKDLVQNLFGGNESAAFRPRPADSYIVPVTIDAPRDLPIEVQYNPTGHFTHTAKEPYGIDLFWVTPDSPRDANGKPVAKIVPTDVLYSEPPSTVEKPSVRSANSMLSADFLYFPTQGAEKPVSLTIHLADDKGNPTAGKHVRVSSVTSFGGPDTLVQPDKPTDQNGDTVAKIPAGSVVYGHDSTIFATDVDDLVDVAQVGHVTFQSVQNTLIPEGFSPYFDPRIPEVKPLPLRAGQPVTITMPLVNRNTFAVEVTAIFSAAIWNIGAAGGQDEIGRVKNITLQPREHKEVGITWTPREATHLCFIVQLRGHAIMARLWPGNPVMAALLPTSYAGASQPVPAGDTSFGSQQRNIGPVEPCTPPNTADPTMFGLPGINVVNSRYGGFRAYPKDGRVHTLPDPSSYDYSPQRDEKIPNPHSGNDYTSHDANGKTTKLPFTCPIKGKVKYPYRGSPTNTLGVISCDGKYTLQFLHASRVDVHGGQEVSPGTQLGVTGDTGAGFGNVHLHVQVVKSKTDKNGKVEVDSSGDPVGGDLVDPNAEGPLVDPPPCDPWPCPQVGPRPGPPSFYEDRGAMHSKSGPFGGSLKRRATAFGKTLEAKCRRHVDETSLCIQDPSLCGVIQGGEWLPCAASAAKMAKDPPQLGYQRVAVSASDTVPGDMDAVTASMERYRGAEAAGDRDWTARQFTAMQLYLRRLAEALRREADVTQKKAEQLPTDDATTQAKLERERQQILERLRRTGQFTPGDLRSLSVAGIPEGVARETLYLLLAYPHENMEGKVIENDEAYTDVNPLPVRSVRAMMLDTVAEKRELASEAVQIAMLPPGDNGVGASADGFLQTFTAGNPHDRQENVDLFIRPISIPPDWKLSIVNAEQPETGTQAPNSSSDPVQFPVHELEAGKHYAVTLPAKAQVKVASVVVPVGEVGANTTARWAVEGRIGDELIGGMVHEMNVPYIIADLQLPPVGSKEVEEELPAPSRLRLYLAVAVAGVLIIAALMLLVFWRKRRAKIGPA